MAASDWASCWQGPEKRFYRDEGKITIDEWLARGVEDLVHFVVAADVSYFYHLVHCLHALDTETLLLVSLLKRKMVLKG